MTPLTEKEAGELAVWLGQIFTHLNDEQVREFKRLFAQCGCDRLTVENAVRHYMRDYQYATIAGVGDAIVAQRRRDVAAASTRARQMEDEARVEELIDERIGTMREVELQELRRSMLREFPADIRARMLARPVSAATSALVRAHFRDIIIRELREQKETADGTNPNPPAVPPGTPGEDARAGEASYRDHI